MAFSFDALRSAAVAALLAFSVSSPTLARAEDISHACRTQLDITRFHDRLARTAERLAKNEPLTIVALGSSSTAGAYASSPSACYPSQLADRLREALPGREIRVLNRGVNGEDVQEMMARFEVAVIAEKPDLVLWQAGTNALLRGNSLAMVRAAIEEGVARLKHLGIDVVLIDPQYAPSVLARPQTQELVGLLATMAAEGHADIFPRFAVMKRWHEIDHIPFETFTAPDGLHMNDWSYACFARLLTEAIVESATRPSTYAGAVAPRRMPQR